MRIDLLPAETVSVFLCCLGCASGAGHWSCGGSGGSCSLKDASHHPLPHLRRARPLLGHLVVLYRDLSFGVCHPLVCVCQPGAAATPAEARSASAARGVWPLCPAVQLQNLARPSRSRRPSLNAAPTGCPNPGSRTPCGRRLDLAATPFVGNQASSAPGLAASEAAPVASRPPQRRLTASCAALGQTCLFGGARIGCDPLDRRSRSGSRPRPGVPHPSPSRRRRPPTDKTTPRARFRCTICI